MAYDADPSATHNPSSGGTPSVAWGDILNANFAAIGAAWTSFTPAWTNLTVGNGTQTGAYLKIGKTLRFRAEITLGSTSSVSTDPSLTLPGSSTGITARQIVHARAFDTSGSATYPGTGQIESSGTVVRGLTFAGNTGVSSATVPFTWATGDILAINGELEIA